MSVGIRKRFLKIGNGLRLHFPKAGFVERGKMLQPCTELRGLGKPLRKCLGAREAEDLPAARQGVKAVGEIGDGAIRLEQGG